MTHRHTVQGCRWAESTLFEISPLWTEDDASPWSCHVDGSPRPVDDPTLCATCVLWTPRTPEPLPRDADCNCSCDACQTRDQGLSWMDSK
jgi:hypothetical protein